MGEVVRVSNGYKLVEQDAPETTRDEFKPKANVTLKQEKRVVHETLSAVEVIERTAALLGGAKGLYEFAMKSDRNLSAFWTMIFPRLLALEVRMIQENESQRDAERETENHAHARH